MSATPRVMASSWAQSRSTMCKQPKSPRRSLRSATQLPAIIKSCKDLECFQMSLCLLQPLVILALISGSGSKIDSDDGPPGHTSISRTTWIHGDGTSVTDVQSVGLGDNEQRGGDFQVLFQTWQTSLFQIQKATVNKENCNQLIFEQVFFQHQHLMIEFEMWGIHWQILIFPRPKTAFITLPFKVSKGNLWP